MKVIIVDDEPNAIKLIKSYLVHFSDFELVGTFRNGLKAISFLNNNPIDVIFLDINMPHLNGISLSKMLPPQTAIVFITAYAEHAVESYDVNTIDYLLKPISLERFSKCVTKLLEKSPIQAQTTGGTQERMLIKSGLETHQVRVDAITFLQKDGNYMYYHLQNKKIMARQSIQEALNTLPNHFMQVHKSYIVNIHQMDTISTDTITIDTHQIPIGPQFKAALTQKMQEM